MTLFLRYNAWRSSSNALYHDDPGIMSIYWAGLSQQENCVGVGGRERHRKESPRFDEDSLVTAIRQSELRWNWGQPEYHAHLCDERRSKEGDRKVQLQLDQPTYFVL